MSPLNPFGRLGRAVPRALSSGPHLLFLIGLAVFLVVLPLLHLFTPSATAELIGGNYMNAASAIGAVLAAGHAASIVRRHSIRDVVDHNLRDVLRSIEDHLRTNHVVTIAPAAPASPVVGGLPLSDGRPPVPVDPGPAPAVQVIVEQQRPGGSP